jgi:hypothetical protein
MRLYSGQHCSVQTPQHGVAFLAASPPKPPLCPPPAAPQYVRRSVSSPEQTQSARANIAVFTACFNRPNCH